jgi:hypothetical protein
MTTITPSLKDLLVAGAQWHGTTNMQAAVHLLVFTDLPDRASFLQHVTIIEDVSLPDGKRGTVASVDVWNALGDVYHLPSSTGRLLAIAASLAVGSRVDLRDACSGLGHAHARRVTEAILIATGADDRYTLTEGATS